MNIVYHPDYATGGYADTAEANEDRIGAILPALLREYSGSMVKPDSVDDSLLYLAHENAYVTTIKEQQKTFDAALLSVAGAVTASRLAMRGEAAFALIRPPGHHAGKGYGWGYCFFNNMAVALLSLKDQGRINSALVLDIDTHTGDGTREILGSIDQFYVLNPMAENSEKYQLWIDQHFEEIPPVDILAVSAGFDAYKKDVGKKLDRFDFYQIGYKVKKLAKKMGHFRRFALLEGGYFLPDLGENVLAFCQGLE